MGERTTNIGLYKPAIDEQGYGDEKNADTDSLDKRLQNLPEDGTHGDVAHSEDYAKESQLEADTNAYVKVASGSTTLSGGNGTVDTGITTDSALYNIDVNPGGADIALSFDGGGSRYVLYFEENTSAVGNPTVGWQVVRSEL